VTVATSRSWSSVQEAAPLRPPWRALTSSDSGQVLQQMRGS
jgi:hypothetical protein